MVIRSGVGVTTAAMINIITVAYLRDDFMNSGVMMPSFDRIKITMGNWKVRAAPIVSVATTEKYESMVIWLLMIALTSQLDKKLMDKGAMI